MLYYLSEKEGGQSMKQNVLDTIYRGFDGIPIDPYLLEHHKELFNLFYCTEKALQKQKMTTLPPLHQLFTNEDTLQLEREFLTWLNPDYEEKFMADTKNLFPYASPNNQKYCYMRNPSINAYAIYYPNHSTLEDSAILSHEYTHHLSAKFPDIKKDTSAYTTYCEKLSILSEFKFLDFLEEKNFPHEELEIYKQYIKARHTNNIRAFLTIEPLLEVYLANEKFTEEKLEELLIVNSFYNNLGKENTFYNLQTLTRTSYQKCLHYQHPFGMIQACSLHQNRISNEEFIHLIEIVNTVDVEEFERHLPKKSLLSLAEETACEFEFQKVKK